MKGKKLGSLFLISILALAGIGVSYAGLTDEIFVYGSVNTAYVEFENFEYTGTWVYKVWDCDGAPDNEMVVTDDPNYDPSIQYPDCKSELVSYAYTYPAGDDANYDVGVIYENLMPGVDYVADLHFNIGSIPVIVEHLDYGIIDGSDWVLPLVESGDIWGTMYTSTGKIVELGTQIHADERVNLELHINIPQNNIYQGVEGSFYFDMHIIQWTDPCDPEPKYGNITVEKLTVEEPSDPNAEFSFTITNTSGYSQNFVLGSGDEVPFNYLGLGTYTITETDVPSTYWDLTNIKISGLGYDNEVISLPTATITFDLLDHGEVQVTFTNDEDEPAYEKPALVLPCGMNLYFEHRDATDSYWELTINSIEGTGDWSEPIAVDNTLRGWCVDEYTNIVEGTHDVTVVPYEDRETYHPGNDHAPTGITDWDCVDYIINLHRLNNYDRQEVQDAIWYYVNGGNYPDGAVAQGIIADVNANAVDWVNDGRPPMVDVLWLGVLLDPDGTAQLTIIEIDP